LDDLEDEEFPDLRDAAALELVTFDAERPVSDPDLTWLANATDIEAAKCKEVVKWVDNVVGPDNVVLLSEGSLELADPEDEDEELNEWLEVAIDGSATEDKARGMNMDGSCTRQIRK
jgi:hypothetical protein